MTLFAKAAWDETGRRPLRGAHRAPSLSLARERIRISDFGFPSSFGFRVSDFCP